MLRNLAISAVLSVGAISVAHADVFRWVDDHGGVHYSDQWVPGSEVIKSSPKSPGGGGGSYAATHSTSPAPRSSSSSPSQESAVKDVKADLAKVRDQQCKEAKDRYEKAIQARRIYKSPAPGDKAAAKDTPDDRQYLSDEEADAYRVKARQDVNDLCGPTK